MVLKICPVFVSVSGSTSAQLNYKEFAEINQHYNGTGTLLEHYRNITGTLLEQSIRLSQNDAQSYIALHACSFKLEEWRPFYPE